ncbi:hypothetical protein M3Y95_00104700 [Aphelenchoides besseyi]|nr:hypothetical protein M3Y95_00104700 [Aphelenchoides besseyi]
MSSAEEMAQEFESGEKDINLGSVGKRSKADQAEHKHPHPEGDTRKMVSDAMRGEEKRKEQNLGKTAK